jgi:hypothetical protein
MLELRKPPSTKADSRPAGRERKTPEHDWRIRYSGGGRRPMRNLTDEEIDLMDEIREDEETEGFFAVETTIQELADIGAETCCGHFGNKCFAYLASHGYRSRKCRGWLNPNDADRGALVGGIFHIRIQTDKTAEKIENLAADVHGSLRFDGDSIFEGYKVFEIE